MHVTELPSEATAEAMAERLVDRPGLAWLDGDGSGSEDGRFSFVASDPTQVVTTELDAGAPLSFFDRLASAQTEGATGCALPAELPLARIPLFVGYIAYDASFSGRPRRHARSKAKVACFARYEACLAFDHAGQRAFVIGDDRAACERLRARLVQPARELVARVGAVRVAEATEHAAAIERALEHIARGDIYQVNLARAFAASYEGDALALALAMRRQSPVPFGFFFDDGGRAIVGRSMERFLRFRRATRTLVTRPIKGTLARAGRDADEASTLAHDPKERAEHAMIIDLMRNDLSRVAELGSVRVPEIMAVERYAKLSHLVSTVECRTRPEVDLREILEATFPPGSVTGTPKLRAMEIIEALESEPRGVYTGAYGHVSRDGGLELAVAIRTAVVEHGQARYFAGGGIVEASQVARELAETELKARVFCDALEALGEIEAQERIALSAGSVLR